MPIEILITIDESHPLMVIGTARELGHCTNKEWSFANKVKDLLTDTSFTGNHDEVASQLDINKPNLMK